MHCVPFICNAVTKNLDVFGMLPTDRLPLYGPPVASFVSKGIYIESLERSTVVMIVLLQLVSGMKDQVIFRPYLEGYVGVFPAILIESP